MTEEKIEDTKLWKTIEKHKEQDKQLEEQKRKMIEEGDKEGPLRNFEVRREPECGKVTSSRSHKSVKHRLAIRIEVHLQ